MMELPGKGGQKTCFAGGLAVAQLYDDVVGALFEADVSGSAVHQGTGREVVPLWVGPWTMNVRPGRCRFPAAIDLPSVEQ